MNPWHKSWEQRRAKTEQQKIGIAARVADGWSVAAAGRDIGVSQQRSSQLWKMVRDDLGWQAV